MNDINHLEKILVLLKESYSSTNSSRLKEVGQTLNSLSQDMDIYLDVLLHGLSSESFNEEKIPFELHQSLAVNLKNFIMNKKYELTEEQISYLIKNIFQLFFPQIKNKNLLKNSLINIFKFILQSILELLPNQQSENLFLILINTIKKEYPNKTEFAINAKIVIEFIEAFFDSKIVNNNNYVKVINEYYCVIIDKTFEYVKEFINPEKNMFDEEYFNILNCLIKGMFINLRNVGIIDDIDNVKYCELITNVSKKYGKLILELIKIQVPLGEKSKNAFINQNKIISFTLLENENLHSIINTMKSNCFQYFSFTIEKASIKSKNGKLISFTLNDQYLIELFAELTKLIIASFQDILSNKEKFLTIIRSKEGILSQDKNVNNLIYNIFLFLSRYLIRNPIIKEFSSHIKYFMLNILFPFATLEESEKQFIEENPDTYIKYIQDILYDFKFRNFRTSLCFLFKKIFENYDECSLILSYVVEMLIYIFNVNNGNNSDNNINEDDMMKYRVYLNEENKSLLNNFNDEIKIDFCLLIILLLKSKIVKLPHVYYKFMLFFLCNQEKIHQINSSIILIKICEIYKEYIPTLFNNNVNLSSKQEEEIKIKTNKSFMENMLNFLLNIILNSTPEKNGNNEISKEALVTKASDTILNLFNFSKENHFEKFNRLNIIFPEKIRNSFKVLISLINTFSNNTYFVTVISCIINEIKINERQDIFNCLKIFTDIFIKTIKDMSNDLIPRNSALFINQYFTLIKHFLTGENKLNNNEKSESKIFNEIISPVIACITQTDKYLYFDGFVQIGECYIKSINGIDDLSIKILDNIFPIIKKEKVISGYYYSFLASFLSFINMYNINTYSNHINIIMKIIKFAYSFINSDNNNADNMLYTLLLTIQILSLENSVFNNDDIIFLISENIKYCVEYLYVHKNTNKKEEENDESLIDNSLIEKIKQVLLSNFSIFFLYYPEILIKILINNITSKTIKAKNIYDFINQLFSTLFTLTGEYFPLLGKCNILFMCSLFSNKNYYNNILIDNNKKKNIFNLLIQLVTLHKSESKKMNYKYIDNNIHCEFVDCEENEENSENKEDEVDKNFLKEIKIAIKNYENVIKCDEFKIFSDTFLKVKIEDENLMNEIMNDFDKEEMSCLYKLLHVRNIKVEFNGVQVEIPRRTLKIKRNGD